MIPQADEYHPGVHVGTVGGGPWEPTPWADAVAVMAYIATGAFLVALATA